MAAGDNTSTATDKRIGSRIGYAIAAVVNLGLLFIANNVLAWGWFPFLTDDFEQLLPIVNLSFAVGAGTNAAFIFYDASWFRSLGQIVENIVSLFVIVATLKIFPFDFSAYSIDWETIARVGLILVGAAVGIATIVEIVKLIRAVIPSDTRALGPS